MAKLSLSPRLGGECKFSLAKLGLQLSPKANKLAKEYLLSHKDKVNRLWSVRTKVVRRLHRAKMREIRVKGPLKVPHRPNSLNLKTPKVGKRSSLKRLLPLLKARRPTSLLSPFEV